MITSELNKKKLQKNESVNENNTQLQWNGQKLTWIPFNNDE